jgi:hypothetical protein
VVLETAELSALEGQGQLLSPAELRVIAKKLAAASDPKEAAQRAKDYPAIAELARLLPPEKEVELTTDPDRILALASQFGAASRRKPVQAAREGKGRQEVVVALAQDIDRLQQLDHKRLARYQEVSQTYLAEFRKAGLSQLPLLEAHQKCCDLALKHLPLEVRVREEENGDA